MISKRRLSILAFVTPFVLLAGASLHNPLSAQSAAPSGEWRTYGGDLASTRYAPLDQINGSNFNTLQIAWRFKTDAFGPRPEVNFEGTPLMVGGDLTRADAWTTSLLTNPEVLAVDQSSTGNHPALTTDKAVLWLAKAAPADGLYVAAFNLQDSSQTVEYSWKQLGLDGTRYAQRNLWEHKDLGIASSLKVVLPPHGSVLYRVSEVAR